MNPVQILLVEDNLGDIELFEEALSESQLHHTFYVVRNGEDALKYLNKQAPYQKVTTPNIVVLDLNLPRLSGLDVLTYIKGHTKLKYIPVVILSTSQNESDILGSYRHYANCYISKPADLDQYIEVAKQIERFWMTIVKLPPCNA